jgi:hypothetical protein
MEYQFLKFKLKAALMSVLLLALTVFAQTPMKIERQTHKLAVGKVQGTITFTQSSPGGMAALSCSKMRVHLMWPRQGLAEKVAATVTPTQSGNNTCSFSMTGFLNTNFELRLGYNGPSCPNSGFLRWNAQYTPSQWVKFTQAGEVLTRNITVGKIWCEEPPQ